MRRALLGSLLATCVVFAVPALAAPGSNRVVGNCTKSQAKPTEIVLACADDNAYVDHITWKGFGGTTAVGSGTYTENTCTPNCVSGTFKSYRVELTASDAKRCPDHYDDYRKLAMAFVATPPKGLVRHDNEKLFCPIP